MYVLQFFVDTVLDFNILFWNPYTILSKQMFPFQKKAIWQSLLIFKMITVTKLEM